MPSDAIKIQSALKSSINAQPMKLFDTSDQRSMTKVYGRAWIYRTTVHLLRKYIFQELFPGVKAFQIF